MTGTPATEHATLTPSEARAYYDWFGRKQDTQGFYEDPALDDLIAHAGLQGSRKVFEFGCGTGKLAARLLAEHLPASAIYLGCDISPVMVGLAARRLEPYPGRATVLQADGAVRFSVSDHSVDRVVSSYVLDLLSEENIRAFFREAHRVLAPDGRLCLASLTRGTTVPSRAVSALWTAVYRIRPSIVGGCRPVRLEAYVDRSCWRREYRNVLTPFAVPSEVMVLMPRCPPGAPRGRAAL